MALLTNGKGDVLEIVVTEHGARAILHDNDGNSAEASFSLTKLDKFLLTLDDELEQRDAE